MSDQSSANAEILDSTAIEFDISFYIEESAYFEGSFNTKVYSALTLSFGRV